VTRFSDLDLHGMFPFSKGNYRVEVGYGEKALAQALPLRALCFRTGTGDGRDGFDAEALQVVLRDVASGLVVCAYRLALFQPGQIGHSYSAQFYKLDRLQRFSAPMLELGRFAIHPERHDPDILRLAWAAMTRLVDGQGVGLLFGCASFERAEVAPHRAALRWLAARALAPEIWRPEVGAAVPVAYAHDLAGDTPDLAAAMAQMPPLLRTYLAMGGWVSDHAVLDRDLDTLHVFTAVEIAAIPPARARALREIAGG
jgi:L-ornithine Nalpha-acyltransferase